MARQKIVAGNWKMNKNLKEGQLLAQSLAGAELPSGVEIIMCTPFIHLESIANTIKGVSNLKLGAQNCHQEKSGAFTGEISAEMLASIDGLSYVILGHSERRSLFGEDNDLLAQKTDAVLSVGLRPIFCCGEPLEVRNANEHVKLVSQQLSEGLFHLSAEDFSRIVIAYEPVWAIGTGVTASPEQAQDMHQEIRQLIAGKYGAKIADDTSILYGGSVKPGNAKELFSQVDVDGGLVGGASLKADDFLAIAGSY